MGSSGMGRALPVWDPVLVRPISRYVDRRGGRLTLIIPPVVDDWAGKEIVWDMP